MTKSCGLLNFDRLYVTSYDAIWKMDGKQIQVSVIIIDLFSMELYTCEQEYFKIQFAWPTFQKRHEL